MTFLLFFAALLSPGFRNIAQEAGLTRVIPNGGSVSKQYILETTGSGAAFLDYDNDGLPDIFLVSGEGGSNRLYHNEGDGRFRDVTESTGLLSSGWGQGVCAGDYDNDGYIDLFVTYWGANRLYRNLGGKRFEDVTAAAHLLQPERRYNTGCAFLDYNRDGRLDLVIANYLHFDFKTTPKPGANPYCYYRGIAVNCGPRELPFETNWLYRGNADGTFTDVSAQSGIGTVTGSYSLGVLTGDFNGDGWTDIFFAADQTPSLLFLNRKDETFAEEGVIRGAAFDENGRAMSGMGATAADYDGNGWLDIFRTNFSDERETLYRNKGSAEFDDSTIAAALGRNTRYVGWGCGFFDFDNDGWNDLLLVNGHVFPEVDRLGIDIRYRQPAILYRNLGNGHFADVSREAGPALRELHVSRGAAFADIANDGRVAVLVNNQNESPSLFQLAAKPAAHWLALKLVGTTSNRSAIGASVRVESAGRTRIDEVRSGGSYLSQNDLRLHFGLGERSAAERVTVRWPSGKITELRNVAADRIVTIVE